MQKICYLLLLALLIETKLVTFDNNKPRLDTKGNIVNAHDGTIQKFQGKGPYYIHAAEYGLCKEPQRYGCDQTPDACGFQYNHNITIFKSNDMSSGSWEYVGSAIEVKDRPRGVVYRPHTVYNPNTKKYVLWWNYFADGVYMGYAAATADNPDGPFVLQRTHVNTTQNGGDFDIYVDPDTHKGYLIYSHNYISIEELNDDFLSSTGRSAIASPGDPNPYIFQPSFVEAPAMFKRNNIYYALFSWCCCYCYQGSGIVVHTALHPMGPWRRQPGPDIACKKISNSTHFGAEPTPGQGCQHGDPTTTSTVRAQQNYVVRVDTPNGVEYIWTGDRWQQAPDGIKGHDPQTWIPLKFNPDGSIQFVDWVDSFTIDVI